MCLYVCVCVCLLSLSRARCVSHGEEFKGTAISYGAKVSINHHRRGMWKNHTSLIQIQAHAIAGVLLQDSTNLQAWTAQTQATALQHSTF